ncbi:MAG: dipeptidase [Candidatus Bathyarchaeota archaeon]|nr:dipeptidase [Candidatus Bathyarchaeota archaeon]
MIELTKSQEERAMRLHKEAIVIDTHCDSLGGYLPRRRRPIRVFTEDNEEGQIDLPKLIKGGVTCQVFAICTAGSISRRYPSGTQTGRPLLQRHE